MPIGGRPSASVRAPQTGATVIWRSGATSATGMSRWAGSRTSISMERSIVTSGPTASGQRLAPDGEHGVGGDERVAQRARLGRVELLGRVAVLGVGEVEVARHAQQVAGAHRGPRAEPAVRHVRLDRAQVAAAVEDDGQRVAQRERPDLERDRGGVCRVDQGPPEELVAMPFVLHGAILSLPGTGFNRPRGPEAHEGLDDMTLLYKPFGIILGILAGIAGRSRSSTSSGARSTTRSRPRRPPRRRTGSRSSSPRRLQGAIFEVTRAAVDRAGAKGFAHLTGVWPGEKRPDPE